MDNHQHQHSESARIGFAFWLNLLFAVLEFVGGALTNSVAIMSGAVHDLGDALAIGFGWLSSRIAQRVPDQDYTYGYRRLSLLSAMVNGLILTVGSVWVIASAVPRLWQPQLPHVSGMFGLAVLGVIINTVAALRLRGGHTHNEKILSWHLLEDVLGWVAVLLASIAIHFTGWGILDPLLSILFTLFILFNVVRNTRNTLRLFLQVSPERGLTEQVRTALESLPAVAGTHHLHLWSLDGQHHVLTTHLSLRQDLDTAQQLALKHDIHELLEPFELTHTTIEFELPAEICRDH
jgi:cobalt-zinc-cadmium efflux system protein